MKPRENYSRFRTALEYSVLILLLAVVGVLVYLNFFWQPMPENVKVIPMANQCVTWEGAGYNGIYGK